MTVRIRFAAALFVCSSTVGLLQTGVAQMNMGGDAASTAVGSPVSPAAAEDAMLSTLEHEMTAVVNAMPADKFNFAPSSGAMPGAKFDGVRTFAQEVTHVIGGTYYFYSQVSGMKPDVDMKAINALKSKDEIVQALAASFAFAHRAVATITPSNAFLAVKPVDGQNTRATIASFAVAHGFDHYGQMVEYLRMNGITPPGSK